MFLGVRVIRDLGQCGEEPTARKVGFMFLLHVFKSEILLHDDNGAVC